MVSADTYQSAAVLQELAAAGFKTQILSVDRVNSDKICEPYQYLKSAIYDRRVKIYNKCDLLTNELVDLERESSGKINHPEGGKYGSKDQADGFCGALFMASKFAAEYAYSYGESLSTTLATNLIEDRELQKAELIANFEAELTGIYKELDLADKEEADEQRRAENQRRKQDFQMYKDIMDGIIIF